VTALKQQASGTIDASEDHVRLEVTLPWLLAGLAQGAQAMIREPSASGHSLPKWVVRDTSDLPPKATEERTSRDVSNVPNAEMGEFSSHHRKCRP
jgi:hypothetical protein